MAQDRDPSRLRSQRWFAAEGMRAFSHRQRMQQMGFRRDELVGRPVIGILNTWSDLSPCHAHLRERAEAVKRGIWRAGGAAVELPALSLGEVIVKPTTMLYRNMLAMEAEELLRSHPVDGAVLMGGCDKTAPGLVMGALSMDIPVLFMPAGPMLNGYWRGEKVGAGTHTRRFWDELQSGGITQADWSEIESVSTRSPGTCNTMGTASTMTSIVEALGLTLPGAAAIPAMDAAHKRMASSCGERIVDMVWEDMKPTAIVTARSVRNAIVALCALGGSTNAVIHLVAIAQRAGLSLDLDAFDRTAREVPVLANLMPAGNHLMEDLFFAGGVPAVLSRVRDKLDLDCMTVSGKRLGETLEGVRVIDDDVIRPLDRPVSEKPPLAILRGNLAPEGAVIKPSAASPKLLRHRGKAVVFDHARDLYRRIEDPALPIDETSVLVLRNAGPIGGPGMPEWGNLPIPKRLLERGVRDMVRLSDARMSGTHFGTCVLHISPEAAVGGPLALVRDGDEIVLDLDERRLDLVVGEEELARRRTEWTPPEPHFTRGYGAIFQSHIQQAHQGCDFDVLRPTGKATPEPDIY
jgi:dihydroxy-acid dehydratase